VHLLRVHLREDLLLVLKMRRNDLMLMLALIMVVVHVVQRR